MRKYPRIIIFLIFFWKNRVLEKNNIKRPVMIEKIAYAIPISSMLPPIFFTYIAYIGARSPKAKCPKKLAYNSIFALLLSLVALLDFFILF